MDRALNVCQIAEAVSANSFLAGEVYDPSADAVGDFKPPRVTGCFVGFKVSNPDQGSPNNDRLVAGVGTASTGEIEMITPAVIRELAGLDDRASQDMLLLWRDKSRPAWSDNAPGIRKPCTLFPWLNPFEVRP